MGFLYTHLKKKNCLDCTGVHLHVCVCMHGDVYVCVCVCVYDVHLCMYTFFFWDSIYRCF